MWTVCRFKWSIKAIKRGRLWVPDATLRYLSPSCFHSLSVLASTVQDLQELHQLCTVQLLYTDSGLVGLQATIYSSTYYQWGGFALKSSVIPLCFSMHAELPANCTVSGNEWLWTHHFSMEETWSLSFTHVLLQGWALVYTWTSHSVDEGWAFCQPTANGKDLMTIRSGVVLMNLGAMGKASIESPEAHTLGLFNVVIMYCQWVWKIKGYLYELKYFEGVNVSLGSQVTVNSENTYLQVQCQLKFLRNRFLDITRNTISGSDA